LTAVSGDQAGNHLDDLAYGGEGISLRDMNGPRLRLSRVRAFVIRGADHDFHWLPHFSRSHDSFRAAVTSGPEDPAVHDAIDGENACL
jgi:hypothetical protein